MFEAEFGTEGTELKVVELCSGGAKKALTRDNASEYIELFL